MIVTLAQLPVGQLLQDAARAAQGPTPETARPILSALFAKAPDHADGHTVLGLVEQRAGKLAAACAAFGRAVALDPQAAEKRANYGVALKNNGQIEDAIAMLESALALRPGAPSTHNNLGNCLLAADRPAEAEAQFRAALAAKPVYAEGWNNLGVALMRLAQPEAAIAAYRRALDIRPDYAEAGVNLALAQRATGDVDAALATLDQVLQQRPAHWPAANNRGLIAEEHGDLDAAETAYRRAIALAPDVQGTRSNLAGVLLRKGDPAAALVASEEACARPGAGTTPLALKAVALCQLGETAARDALYALDRYVRIIDFQTMPGFDSLDAFNRAIMRHLEAHPTMTFEPSGLVTRTGRQSSDLLLGDKGPVAALEAAIRTAVKAYMADITGDDHVFARACPAEWGLTLWGTVLEPGGAVDAHIHAPNWLSGCYYPALPDATRAQAPEGWFEIGRAPAALGGSAALRTIEPRVGRMILFPSYYYHRTLDFGGTMPRASLAFDVVPKGTGRPHRLDYR